MKISLLGPSNLDKFSKIINKPIKDIEAGAKEIGKVLSKKNHSLIVVFNYAGMLKLVGDSYKREGGKLNMLFTENDYDWDTEIYMDNLNKADIKIKKDSWHDMLLSLVKDSDIVLCAGLSAGVLAELAYIKFNIQEKKGKVKKLIGVKEFLRKGEFPPEIYYDLKDIIVISKIEELEKLL